MTVWRHTLVSTASLIIPSGDKKTFYLTYLLIAVSQLAEWSGLQLSGKDDSLMFLLKIVKCADYICTPAIGGVLVAQMRIRNRINTAI